MVLRPTTTDLENYIFPNCSPLYAVFCLLMSERQWWLYNPHNYANKNAETSPDTRLLHFSFRHLFWFFLLFFLSFLNASALSPSKVVTSSLLAREFLFFRLASPPSWKFVSFGRRWRRESNSTRCFDKKVCCSSQLNVTTLRCTVPCEKY